MSLREEINAVHKRALSALHEAHDYFTYTKRVWRQLQVAASRDGLTFRFHNRTTGSTVDQNALVSLAQRYVSRELPSATLQDFVAIFENFLKEVLHCWLLAFPESLSAKSLTGKEILALSDKQAIVDALVEKELLGLLYDRPANWFNYLDKNNLAAVDKLDVDKFAEVKATRDVLVHGQGIANDYYMSKAGRAARVQLGERLEIPEPYHRASWELICKLVERVGSDMASKAEPPRV